MRPEIDLSWRRSVVAGVRPDHRPEPVVDVDFESREALLRAVQPIFDAAADQLADTGVALILTDPDSRIIAMSHGGPSMGRDLEKLGVLRGAVLAEDVVGTCALGTPAETRSPITVNGSEHYLDVFKQLSCYGRPIVDPTTRRLEGTLCMTAAGDTAHPLFQPMVNRFADDIQARLRDAAHASHRLVLEAFHSASQRRGTAVVAVGDDLLLTNNTAANLLDSADIGALRNAAADRSGVLPSAMTLTSGREVQVQAQRIAGAPTAAVFMLRPLGGSRQRIPRGPRVLPNGVFDRDSVVIGATGHSLAVLGEPGSGRTTRAVSALGDRQTCRIDVAGAIGNGAPLEIASAMSVATSTGAALVVDGFDLLSDHDLAVVQWAVVGRTIPVVVTGPPPEQLRSAAQAVSALCDEQILTTPLRQQSQKLPAIAQRFVDRHAPGVTLGAGVVDALLAHDWPANLAELDRALHAATERAAGRGSRRLDVDDLPQRYRSSGRTKTLTALERMERQGIIDALARCQGNKAHAAKQLGISRSTLYLRLRALGIDG